jgi:catechol 2,3-dioxygenase-like lactoylglutathione lyase family enzyme
MPEPVVHTISPMLSVADVDATEAFFCEVLDFRVVRRDPKYRIVERDGQLVHIKLAWSDAVLQGAKESAEIYIAVSGIDALWERVEAFKDRFQTRDLFDREYGMTEFHIKPPGGECVIFVGEPTDARNRM